MTRAERIAALKSALKERILILDGAMGTMLQTYELKEPDFRGERFADWGQDVGGNNDLLTLTQPQIIREVHDKYLAAGADILETNTFSSTTIAQADYAMEDLAFELNKEGARLAREAADAQTAKTPERPRFVAGTVGPTNRTASISPDVNRPEFRNTSYDQLREAYAEAARGLIEGGADTILIETIFDTLNAKAAIHACQDVFDEIGEELPIMISVTITDQSGRTLSGQTATAFWYSVRHARPLSVGVNCALGPDLMRPYVLELSQAADVWLSAYPNAGLPNAFGGYDETPESMTVHLREWAESGLLNIVGGCCGTTDAHIRAFAEAVADLAPRSIPEAETEMKLSGLEPFKMIG